MRPTHNPAGWRAALVLLVLALWLALGGSPAYAQTEPGSDDRVQVGADAVVRGGETLRGNLIAVGGRAIVEPGARVLGDAVSVGGSASVAGEVTGSVVIWGGSVDIAATAVVRGDVVVAGGAANVAPGAQIDGTITEGLKVGQAFRQLGFAGGPFRPPARDNGPVLTGWLRDFLRRAFATAGVLLVAVLLTLFVPRPTARVSRAIADAPFASLGIGFLTLLAAALLLPLLAILSTVLLLICIGVFGYALLTLLATLLVAAILYGWIAAGLFLGDRILSALRVQERLPVIAAIVGVLVISALSSVPCLGGIFGFVVACVGLGAVVLSRAGTQVYPGLIAPPSPPIPV